MSSDLLSRTEALLAARGALTLKAIAAATDLNPEWLQKFANGRIGEPGVRKVQRLHDYLAERGAPRRTRAHSMRAEAS